MIRVLWPTVRPKIAVERAAQWRERCDCSDKVSFWFGINKPEQIDEMKALSEQECGRYSYFVAKDGVTDTATKMTRALLANPGNCKDSDIVILASDDYEVEQGWDTYLMAQFSDFNGMLIANDCEHYTPKTNIIPIPICSGAFLKRMNGVLYHPAYSHFFSDEELYSVVMEIGNVRDRRSTGDLRFQHRHWSFQGRTKDVFDLRNNAWWAKDKATHEARKSLSLEEKLKLPNGWSQVEKLKIHVYSIAKNEEKFCARWASSCVGADDIHVLDTGSTDGTVSVLKSLNVHVEQREFNPWRFDAARNAALALVPDDVNVVISLDMDEVLCDGWREIVEKAWLSRPNTTELRHMFSCTPEYLVRGSRVHARHGYRWVKPIHEVQVHIKKNPIAVVMPDVLITHLPDPSKSRTQYLDLLRAAVEEEPGDSRNQYYYARELTYHKKWNEAQKELMRHLALPSSTWTAERSHVYSMLAVCAKEIGFTSEIEPALLRACAAESLRREAWFELGDYYRNEKNFIQGYACARRALSITERPYFVFDTPYVWTFGAHDLAAVCAHFSGFKHQAITHAKLALDASPNDNRLIKNYSELLKDSLEYPD